MKKNILVFAVFLLVAACRFSDTTSDNTILAVQEYDLAKSGIRNMEGAEEKEYTIHQKFDEQGASYTIKIRTYEKDSTHTALRNIEVVLDKGQEGYEFTAEIRAVPHNQGSLEAAQMATTVVLGYYTQKLTGQLSGNKLLEVNSKGEVREL
jgi:hypothetical protein